jgi:hypothetical protein
MTARDVSDALASLWVESYGPAADLVGFLKKHPDDPRSVDIPKIEPLLERFYAKFTERDVAAATVIATNINRAMFNCNARELAPLVKTGRKNRRAFFEGRAEANRQKREIRARVWSEWQEIAASYWSRHPKASKNETAAFVVKHFGLDKRQTKTVSRRIENRDRPAKRVPFACPN